MGLAIARGVVERHKGRIEVESELGRGTTFNVTLPTQAPDPELAGVGSSNSTMHGR
jgi:signal transduction histidine kinase